MHQSVTVHSLVVTACWVIGGVVAAVDIVCAAPLGALSLVFIAAGSTLYMKDRVERLLAAWVTAYEAGREVAQLRRGGR